MENKDMTPVKDSGLNNLSKRQQVQKANRMIFVWVAVASVIVVGSLVAGSFLVRQALFNQKVISQKSQTNNTISQNVETAKSLKENVDKLLADDNLAKVKATPGDSNFKVIFDALPTNGDTTTLTNSLYSQIFEKAGVSTDSILVGSNAASVAAASGVPTTDQPVQTVAGSMTAPQPQVVAIQATISGRRQQTLDALKNLEAVIRPMSIGQLSIEVGGDGTFKTTMIGESYFVSADSVKLGKIEVKP